VLVLVLVPQFDTRVCLHVLFFPFACSNLQLVAAFPFATRALARSMIRPFPSCKRSRDAECAVSAAPTGAGTETRGGRLFAEMETLLAREEAERPNSGTVEKTFFGGIDVRKERNAFWTRVRGCAESLADTSEERCAIATWRDTQVAEVRRWVVGAPGPRGKPITTRTRALRIARVVAAENARAYALLPEPMRCQNWRSLRFYPEVVRQPSDAVAFLDPWATPAECDLALESGLHVLCGRHPAAAFTVPALLTALVRYYLADQRVPHERAIDRQARLKRKAAHMNAFVLHMQNSSHTEGAPAVPEAAVVALVVALRAAATTTIAFAARALLAVPLAALAPHAWRVSEAVGAHADNERTLALVEAVVQRAHAPEALNMDAELASAWGV
jgi:hypothetical protein